MHAYQGIRPMMPNLAFKRDAAKARRPLTHI